MRNELDKGAEKVKIGTKTVNRAEAQRLVQRVALKTINRDLTFLTDWGKWMEQSDHRRPMLHNGRNPFSGLLHRKAVVAQESRRAGRKRVGFSNEEVRFILANLPQPDTDATGDLAERQEARYWAPLIGLYTGMRLGEIAQLRGNDFKESAGIVFIDLMEDGERNLKSEAGERQIPLHPRLIELGLRVR